MMTPKMNRIAALLSLTLFAAPAMALQDEWDDDWDDDWSESSSSPWLPLSGFVEAGAGYRLQPDSTGLPRQTYGELTTRIESGYLDDHLNGTVRADLHYDDVTGQTDVDVRELTVAFRLGQSFDMKLGRQVLTWGTGDYLFVNDLFPKDWQAFFSGRDDEYLKSPLNAVKVGYYSDIANVDIVWAPEFESDNYVNGERFSYFSPITGGLSHERIHADEPNDGVYAARVYGSVGSAEWAVYGYQGYTGTPVAFVDGKPDFAKLRAWGASWLAPAGPGLFNAEFAYQDVVDQQGGTSGLPADKLVLMTGYQMELISNLTFGVQYQLEAIADYDSYVATLPNSNLAPDEYRHLVTTRFDYRAMRDKVTLSLFSFYSPSDGDYYLRPQIKYRVNDTLSMAAGFNLLGGKDQHTFFGQLEDNTNGWIRVRYNF